MSRPTARQQADHREHVARLVAAHGVALPFVGGSLVEPQFADTVGLSALGHRDIVVFGRPLRRSLDLERPARF